jgi:hypothetical protein
VRSVQAMDTTTHRHPLDLARPPRARWRSSTPARPGAGSPTSGSSARTSPRVTSPSTTACEVVARNWRLAVRRAARRARPRSRIDHERAVVCRRVRGQGQARRGPVRRSARRGPAPQAGQGPGADGRLPARPAALPYGRVRLDVVADRSRSSVRSSTTSWTALMSAAPHGVLATVHGVVARRPRRATRPDRVRDQDRVCPACGSPGSRTRRSARQATGSAPPSSAGASSWPQERIVVNLAPADLQKGGTGFDLGDRGRPCSAATRQVPAERAPGAVGRRRARAGRQRASGARRSSRPRSALGRPARPCLLVAREAAPEAALAGGGLTILPGRRSR